MCFLKTRSLSENCWCEMALVAFLLAGSDCPYLQTSPCPAGPGLTSSQSSSQTLVMSPFRKSSLDHYLIVCVSLAKALD